MNLYCIGNKTPDKELMNILAKGENIRIERIVSSGEVSPDGFWYDQEEDEAVFLIRGSAVLQFEEGSTPLKEGDWIIIPGHKRHRVTYTSSNPPAVWLCIFGKDIIKA